MNNRLKNKLLLISNVILIISLITLVIKGNYVKQVRSKIFKSEKADYNFVTERYEQRTDFFSVCSEQKNIVMLGNSLTERIDWGELLNRNDIANRGIGSDITFGFVNRIDYVINLKPKICFIEGGINDLFKNIPSDTILKNINTLVGLLQKQKIKPVLTTITFLSRENWRADKTNQEIKKVNKGIYEISGKAGIDIIDLNRKTLDADYLKDEYTVSDGLHFTAKMYMIWRDEIEKVLKEEGI